MSINMEQPTALLALYVLFAIFIVGIFLWFKNKKEDKEENTKSDENKDSDFELEKVNYRAYEPVLQFTIKNPTDKKIKAALFGVAKSNDGLEVSIGYGGYFNRVENLINYLIKHNINFCLVRIQSTNMNMFKHFDYVSGNPCGQLSRMPLFSIAHSFSPTQFQSGIIDAALKFNSDGVERDVLFDMYPSEEYTITLFPSSKGKAVGTETAVWGFPIIVENTSDVEKNIDLFDIEKLESDYMPDEELKIYTMYEGEDSAKQQCNVYQGTDEFGNQKESLKEYMFSNMVKELSEKTYKSIRLVSLNRDQIVRQANINGKLVSMQSYFSAYQFQSIIVDANVGDNQFKSFKTTILPKTKVLYIFGDNGLNQRGAVPIFTSDRKTPKEHYS